MQRMGLTHLIIKLQMQRTRKIKSELSYSNQQTKVGV